jgi:imidazolonepropionase
MIKIDLLIKNIGELINPADDLVVRGNRLNSVRILKNAWIGACGENIGFVGNQEEFESNCVLAPDAVVIEGGEFVAAPGFVDPHTHLPFADTRQDEFREKLQGVSYQEIARRGGGIKGSVRKTRKIPLDKLIGQAEVRLKHILTAGTTTLEAKSGYGLEKDSEIKQLEAVKALNSLFPTDLIPTFMGAHEIPEEYEGQNMEFIKYLTREVSGAVRELGLAEFGDIFCEEGVFSYEEAEYYIDRLKEQGYKIKIHADEFVSNNAVQLAVEKGAVSAEHLIAISEKEIEMIADSDTAAVLLPGVSFFLKMNNYAPAERIIKNNGIVALGTDFNPGSSMISSQLFIMHLGIFKMGLTIEEAFNAITVNAAYAIDRSREIGSIAVGKKMDLILMDIPDYSYMAYHLGINPVHTVIKAGEVVIKNRIIL